MNQRLLPLTRLVLGVSAATQLIFGLAGLAAPAFVRMFLYLPPLEPTPILAIQYFGAFYLASCLGAMLALRENTWSAARTYLIIAGPFVALSLILTFLAAITPPGVPLVMWAYMALS